MKLEGNLNEAWMKLYEVLWSLKEAWRKLEFNFIFGIFSMKLQHILFFHVQKKQISAIFYSEILRFYFEYFINQSQVGKSGITTIQITSRYVTLPYKLLLWWFIIILLQDKLLKMFQRQIYLHEISISVIKTSQCFKDY